MHRLHFLGPILLLTLTCAGPVIADDDGHRGREGKQEFWDGPCKIEREWKKNGDFKEERKCNGRGRPHGAPVVAVAQPVYPPWVVVEGGAPIYRPGQEPAPSRGSVTQCRSEAVGRVLGGIAGAAIGSQVGGGSGRTVATVGGAIAGLLIGGEVGRRIDADNQACIGQALEFAPAGQRVEWENGAQYAVVPGGVVTRKGTPCRPYEVEVLTSAGWQQTRATACRRPDGTWAAGG